jgi:hypothetical protein
MDRSRHDGRKDPDGLEFDADCRNTFWVEAPLCLLSGIQIRQPWEQMSLEERMNNITRIVIVVFVIMFLAKVKHAQTFLIIALLVIIIFYYAKRRRLNEIAFRQGIQAGKLYGKILERRRREKDHSDEHDSDSEDHHYVRSGTAQKSDANFQQERFMAMAGNGSSAPGKDDAEGEDDDAGQNEEEQEVLRQEVEARYRAKQPEKRNPRRPYPPTVPADLVVKAGNREQPPNAGMKNAIASAPKGMGKVFTSDPSLSKHVPNFKSDNKGAASDPRSTLRNNGMGEVNYQLPHPRDHPQPINVNPKTRQTPVKPSLYAQKNDDRFDQEREKNLYRSFQGGPRSYSKRHGFKVQEFEDLDDGFPPPKAIKQPDDDDSDVEAEDVEEEVLLASARKAASERYYKDAARETARQPSRKVANEAVVPTRPKKTFLPSNYEAVVSVQETSTPHKMNAYGAGRRIRKVSKWSDNNGATERIDAAEIMYTNAAKLEKTVNARYRVDRESHINSILSV